MSLPRAFRWLTAAALAVVICAAPVVRTLSNPLAIVSGAVVSSHAGGESPLQAAHRLPRLRRSRLTVAAVPPSSAPGLALPALAWSLVASTGLAALESFAAPPDLPPA